VGRASPSTGLPPSAAKTKGESVIIELHLTHQEDREIGDHLELCENAFCDHIAHLCAALVDDYANAATVFTIGDGSKWRHRRNRQSKRTIDGPGLMDELPASLAIIRQAWDRQEAADRQEPLGGLVDPLS
jgi:hypothetical protein